MARRDVCVGTFCTLLAACGGQSTQQHMDAPGRFPPAPTGAAPYALSPLPPQSQPAAAPGRMSLMGTPSAPTAGVAPAAGVRPLGSVASDPSMLQSIIAGALAGSAASISALTGGEVQPIAQGIKAEAQAQARGMKSEGQLMTARLAQDAHAQGALTLEPGKCYSIVGFGGLGVFKYQINVLTAPPSAPSVLAQSGRDGVTPVVGPSEQCLRNPYPLPMHVKIDMHVVQGQGLVGAQAYVK